MKQKNKKIMPPTQERATLRDGAAESEADSWDQQIGRDVAAGRLDQFATEAMKDLDEGRCIDL